MSTLTTIREIFYSGPFAFKGGDELVSEIAFLVDEGYLSLSVITIADKINYVNLLNDHNGFKLLDEAAGGSNAHIALKVLGKEYIRQNYNLQAVFEHPFCGYYPDVLTIDETVVAECGHTDNPDKMLAYFKQGNIKECIQIPYPSDEDNKIKGYLFRANKDLKEFLIFLEKEKRGVIKKYFSARK